ncbi:MAG: ABC transporter ATP-binding protein [Bacillota bacterium]
MSLIILDKVSKSYKGISLFEDISLFLDKGKIYGFTGPNGSGKSVLFKMICGFVIPDRGEIIVRGTSLTKSKFPDDFGVIINRPGYIANKTGFQNLKDLASIRGKINDRKIEETMETVGLQPKLETKVRNYSLGMKQKLALAQAIMEDQEVLVLDEPFNALDSESVENIRKLLLLLKERGKTILLTSHNKEDITILCDETYYINKLKLEKI